ncbi:CCA tRNA nucleotidyltransferase [bacterium]|nr:CCA tRNA nucleotidyltransferase [bacterium]
MNGKDRIEIGRNLYDWEITLIDEGELYLVGGAVRNLLFGLKEKSFDEDYLVRGISADKLITLLEKYGRTDLVGKSFGVIKFTPAGSKTVDIALPRTEHSTGLGHRDFEVNTDFNIRVEEDLVRRDYTMNSIALNMKNMLLIDPLKGSKDIGKNLIRVNKRESFKEDPLRMLRGVQFLSRFKMDMESATRDLIEREAHLITEVSGERLKEELNKMLLLSDKPGDGFIFMHETGLLRYILPELEETFGIEQNEYHPDDVFHHSINSCNMAPRKLNVRWSALLHDLGKKSAKRKKNERIVFYGHEVKSEKIAQDILSRLKFSKRFTSNVCHLVRHHMFNITEDCRDSTVRRFLSRVGIDNIDDLFALREADALSRGDTESIQNLKWLKGKIEMLLETDSSFKIGDLEIDGLDIMKITGVESGPWIGEILRQLLEEVIEDPSFNNREKLTKIVAKEYKRRIKQE